MVKKLLFVISAVLAAAAAQATQSIPPNRPICAWYFGHPRLTTLSEVTEETLAAIEKLNGLIPLEDKEKLLQGVRRVADAPDAQISEDAKTQRLLTVRDLLLLLIAEVPSFQEVPAWFPFPQSVSFHRSVLGRDRLEWHRAGRQGKVPVAPLSPRVTHFFHRK